MATTVPFHASSPRISRFYRKMHLSADLAEVAFYQKRICSLATPMGRITLSDLRLITTVHSERNERVLASEEEYFVILAEQFGVVI